MLENDEGIKSLFCNYFMWTFLFCCTELTSHFTKLYYKMRENKRYLSCGFFKENI